jgi:hypothetical protein
MVGCGERRAFPRKEGVEGSHRENGLAHAMSQTASDVSLGYTINNKFFR